jgi:RHS repeat-associated protein
MQPTLKHNHARYDGLNRIATAGTVNKSGTNCWSERYGIDAWGNLFSRGPDTTDGYAGSCGYVTPSSYFMNAVNQIASPSGFRYDTAGNMTQTGSASYNYNAENQMAAATTSGWATSTGYLYDGDGNRVAKLNTAGSATKLYWYSGGNVLDETDGTGSMSNTNFNEYVYFGGQRIARRNSSAVYYYVEDHLGTSREIVQAGQTLACYDADFYPYGGEMTITDTCDSAYKFTGKERDTESGLDNFGARYNTSSLGRFMTPDPIFMTKHRLVDPQQWNLYAYVRNNPLNLTDPTGKDLWEKGCGKDTATCHKDYVGTWDKDHKKFTPTKIQSDKNGNFKDHKVTMDTSGIHVDGKYQGVFASGTSATVVNGTGNLSGFQGSFSSNCLGHCEAEGTLSALPGHSFGQLLPTLRGPNEKLDRLSGHEGDQYRGGNKDGPDIHISYLNNRDAQSAHFDWAFPFGSAGGFAQHSADFVEIGIDKAMGKNSDPPYDEVGP